MLEISSLDQTTSVPVSNQIVNGDRVPLLLLYNIFPRHYLGYRNGDMKLFLAELREHFASISAMGFNTVWFNPLEIPNNTEVERINRITGDQQKVTGCLYAKKEVFNNPKFFSQLKNLADEYDLVLMFDLVLNHMGIGSKMIEEHPDWFKNPIPPWDDVHFFKYEDTTIRAEIINFWREEIHKYIVIYGFKAVRIDAVPHINGEVLKILIPYAVDLIQKTHKIAQPIILGETLGPYKGFHDFINDSRQIQQALGITHALNIMHNHICNPSVIEYDEVIKDIQEKFLNLNTAVIGYGGNHDVAPLGRMLYLRYAVKYLMNMADKNRWLLYSQERYQCDLQEENLTREKLFAKTKHELELIERREEALQQRQKQLEKEEHGSNGIIALEDHYIAKIAQIKPIPRELFLESCCEIIRLGCCSYGGYYIMSGDEYGALIPASLFMLSPVKFFLNQHPEGRIQHHLIQGIAECWGGQINFTNLFKSINTALKALYEDGVPLAANFSSELTHSESQIHVQVSCEQWTRPRKVYFNLKDLIIEELNN